MSRVPVLSARAVSPGTECALKTHPKEVKRDLMETLPTQGFIGRRGRGKSFRWGEMQSARESWGRRALPQPDRGRPTGEVLVDLNLKEGVGVLAAVSGRHIPDSAKNVCTGSFDLSELDYS